MIKVLNKLAVPSDIKYRASIHTITGQSQSAVKGGHTPHMDGEHATWTTGKDKTHVIYHGYNIYPNYRRTAGHARYRPREVRWTQGPYVQMRYRT